LATKLPFGEPIDPGICVITYGDCLSRVVRRLPVECSCKLTGPPRKQTFPTIFSESLPEEQRPPPKDCQCNCLAISPSASTLNTWLAKEPIDGDS
jgi:hypothetical protein